MNIQVFERFVGLWLGFAVACLSLDANGQAASTADGVPKSRLEFVQRLIEDSSAARQVESSKVPAAMERWQEAQTLYRRAVAAQDAGQTAEVEALVLQATKAMFEAVRMADQNEVTAEKRLVDLDARIDSVDALLAAHERIASEKNAGDAAAKLRDQVGSLLSRARVSRDEGQTEAARELVDEAYVAAKTSIESLRGGDTLVRSLEFASKKEEYEYEVDRNDTHGMLVTVLLKEKMDDAGVASMVKQHVDRADETRKRAESQAGSGDYEAAVKTMEDATRELVKAIRRAGVYIPG